MARSSFAALLLALAAGSAFAGNKLEPPDLGRYLRWGPVRVRPGLSLSNLGYDDNILLSNNRKVSDISATLSPRLDGLILFGDRAFLTFREQLDYTVYAKNTNQNFWNQIGSARLTVPLGRFGVFADGGLSKVRERPIDRESARPERRDSRLGGGAVFLLGWRTEIELSRTRIDIRYQDEGTGREIADRLDRVEDRNAFEASYLLAGRTRLTLDGSSKDIRFDRSPERDSRETTLMPGVRLERGGTLSGRLRLGWSEVRPRDRGLATFAGVVGDAELAYHVRSSPTKLTLSFERRQGFSVFERDPFFRTTRVEGRAVHYLNRFLGVQVGASAGKLTFQSDAATPREDDLLRYNVGVRFRLPENALGQRIEYVLKVGRYERTSTRPELDNDQTTFGINASVGF